MPSKIEPGTIVDYTLTESDAEEINRRRGHFAAFKDSGAYNTQLRNITGNSDTPQQITLGSTGLQAHVGARVNENETYPAMVMRTGSPSDLLVFANGSDSLWVRSVEEGSGQGRWRSTFE
jgi:hypothetical protein